MISAVRGRMIVFTVLLYHVVRIKLIPTDSLKPVWLIGENRGECLKENGYWLYQYCRKMHTNKSVYFVIKPISPFYKNRLKSDTFVVKYGSLKHASIFYKSSVCLYTHTYRDVIYRRLYELFGRQKKLIYLHHGVLGFKKFNTFYQNKKNAMDIFTIGSLLEKDILINQVGVDERRLRVTGYARYDQFNNRSSNTKLQIIYIPTHRNYIKVNFSDSILFERVKSILANGRLLGILGDNDITLKVYLHKEMQPYSDMLSCQNSCVKVIRFGEETPQELISESHLMITDYSSVSWDFFYLGKPVIFYRFDIKKYLKDRDSYIDLYNGTIGDVVFDETQLVETIIRYVKDNFKMKKNHYLYRQKILPNLDHKNCERIYSEIASL